MKAHVLEDKPGTRLVLGAPRRRERIAFDRERGVLLRHRLPGWLAPITRIPIAALERIRIVVSSELVLRLEITYRAGASLAELARTFAVHDLDVDHEAVDLAFRIATICRFGGYQVRHTDRDHAIELVAQAPDDTSPYRMPFPAIHRIEELASAEIQAIPAILAPARYDDDRPHFAEPMPAVAPPVEGATIDGVRVARWQPPLLALAAPSTISRTGAVVDALRTTSTALGMLVLFGVMGVSFEGCRRLLSGPAGFYAWEDYAAYAVVVILTALLGLVVLTLAYRAGVAIVEVGRALRRTRRQRAARALDITDDTITVVVRSDHTTLPRRMIRGVRLRVRERWSELYLTCADDDLLVAISTLGQHAPQPRLTTLAIGLARELDVPCLIEKPVGPEEAR